MSLLQFQDIPLDNGRAKIEQPNQPIATILNYVERWIPVFIQESREKQIKNENGLTQRFVRILSINLSDTYPFVFDKEGMEDETKGNSPSIDIDVIAKEKIYVKTNTYQKGNRFFAFEAKLLGNTAPYRQKEYLIGHDTIAGKHISCGGIERFKKNIHGEGLNQCGMIGYMFAESFDVWFNNINGWIEELVKTNIDFSIKWSIEDKLKDINIKHQNANCYSNNSRIKNGKVIEPIKLYHIWVNFT